MNPLLAAAAPILTRKGEGDPSNPIEMLAFARALREDALAYAGMEIVHIIGFAILVGSIVMFDLRVLGLSRTIPVRALRRHLMPWTVGALALIVPTGFLMFSAHASDLISNRAFQVKMALLMAAGINAAIFHTGPYQSVASWDTNATAPLGARASVALSIAIWFSIIACGRLLAYL